MASHVRDNNLLGQAPSDLIPVGTVTSMDVAFFPRNAIDIAIAPTSKAASGKIYFVELYEKGVLRARGTISWNQPEINVKKPVNIYFPVSEDEFNAYFGKDITGIFSVKIKEQ